MSFLGDPSNHFSLKELYRVRRQSLSVMVQDCYDQVLKDPVITILNDSKIIQQHKVQSIERIVQTLIDSESEMTIAKLTTDVELLESSLQLLKGKLENCMVEAQQKSERESPDMLKRKLVMLQDERQQEQEQFKAMLKQYGFEFVNSLQYSLQRVLKEYSFASRGVATREELINRLYKQLGRENESSSKGSTPSRTAVNGHSNEQLLSEIDRLNGLVRTLADSKDSTCSLLQKKLEDAEHKNARDIKLLKDNELKLREQIELKSQRLEQEKREVEDRVISLQRECIQVKEDCGLLRTQLEQATINKHEFQVRLKQLEVVFDGVRSEMEAIELENKDLRTQLADDQELKEQMDINNKELGKQLNAEREHANKLKTHFEDELKTIKQNTEEKQSSLGHAMDALEKENMELRQRLVSALAELELLRTRPSLRVIPPPEQHPHSFVAQMQKVCNQRIDQFEKELQQKNSTIVELTKQKLQLLRTIQSLEQRHSQLDLTKKNNQYESAALVDDISIILKTLQFERKLHQQESMHLRKIMAIQSAKFAKETTQLKQLLSQKETAIKRLESRKCEHRHLEKAPQFHELKEQLNKLSTQFRTLQEKVKRDVQAASQLFQLPSIQDQPLTSNNRTRKIEYSCIRRQSPPNHSTRKLAQHERYLHHLDNLLDSSSDDQQ